MFVNRWVDKEDVIHIYQYNKLLFSSKRRLRRALKRGQEELPHIRGQGQKPGRPYAEGRQPRGVTPRPRSGAVAQSARLRQRRNGREQLPHVRGQGRRVGGATPRRRPGGAAERRSPESKVRGGDERSYPMSEVRGGGREEILHALKYFILKYSSTNIPSLSNPHHCPIISIVQWEALISQ